MLTYAIVAHRTDPPLLTPEFIARLEALELLGRKLLTGKIRGAHRSRHRGESIQFADYRNYVPGDDPRWIDWNIYARLDRLFLKLFVEEDDLALHLLVDASASCRYGEPDKFRYIQQVAAALAYIALASHNRVTISAFSDGVTARSGTLRGRGRSARMIAFLTALQPDGAGDFTRAARQFALLRRERGICLVLSDFDDTQGCRDGLRHLASARHDLFAVQVLSPQELAPPMRGDVQLRDIENDTRIDVAITPGSVARYQSALQACCRDLEDQVLRLGGAYLFATTATPFDRLVLDYLRRRGLLR